MTFRVVDSPETASDWQKLLQDMGDDGFFIDNCTGGIICGMNETPKFIVFVHTEEIDRPTGAQGVIGLPD